MAAELGIARAFGEVPGDTVDSGHLDRQHVSKQTLLSDLNAGRGVTLGDFQITDSNGGIHIVRLSDNPSITTVGDVLAEINRTAPASIEAQINDRGDGIMIIDKAGGSGVPVGVIQLTDRGNRTTTPGWNLGNPEAKRDATTDHHTEIGQEALSQPRLPKPGPAWPGAR